MNLITNYNIEFYHFLIAQNDKKLLVKIFVFYLHVNKLKPINRLPRIPEVAGAVVK